MAKEADLGRYERPFPVVNLTITIGVVPSTINKNNNTG
jgi:hypothetical protein